MKKIKKKLNRLYDLLENDSLKRGIDITSDDFEMAIKKMTYKMLKENNISIDDFVEKGFLKENERLSGQISKTLDKVTQIAIKEGLDISSKAFSDGLHRVKSKIMNRRNVSEEDLILLEKDKNKTSGFKGKIEDIKEFVKGNKEKQEALLNEGLAKLEEKIDTTRKDIKTKIFKEEIERESQGNFLGNIINKLFNK